VAGPLAPVQQTERGTAETQDSDQPENTCPETAAGSGKRSSGGAVRTDRARSDPIIGAAGDLTRRSATFGVGAADGDRPRRRSDRRRVDRRSVAVVATRLANIDPRDNHGQPVEDAPGEPDAGRDEPAQATGQGISEAARHGTRRIAGVATAGLARYDAVQIAGQAALGIAGRGTVTVSGRSAFQRTGDDPNEIISH
jgi:hypothetical protein